MDAGPESSETRRDEKGLKIGFSRRSLAFLGLGLLAILVFLYAFADIGEAISIISTVNLYLYSLSFVSVTLGTLAYTLAWHVLLRSIGARIKVFTEWAIIWVSVFLNILIPTGSVSGEFVRVYLTLKSLRDTAEGKSVGELVSTVIAHRVITIGPFLLGSVLGFAYLSSVYKGSAVVIGLASMLVVLFSAAFLCVFYVSFSPGKAARLAEGLVRLVRRLSIQRLNRRLDQAQPSIDENVRSFDLGMEALRRSPRSLGEASLLSLIFWALDAFVAYFVFQSIGYPVSFQALLFVYTIGITIQMIPIGIPGMVGIVEVTMIALYSAADIPLKVGAAATILIRIVMLWFEALVGGVATYLILWRSRK